jgi:hypothetical protein
MPRKRKTSVDLGASAKVEAIAKVSYARKKNTLEVIPPDVTRAKANAWLDLISPLTEWAGLKGDELRLKRMQLRLQREDVLSKIVESASDKIKDEQVKTPIPNKFLIPFLEQASLEDLDSALIEMWANLLASAATKFSSHHVHFVSIISQLSPKQGIILKSLIATDSAHQCELGLDNIGMYFATGRIRKTIENKASKVTTDADFYDALDQLLYHVNVTVVGIKHENIKTRAFYTATPDYSDYRDENEIDYSILEAVGLIRRVETDFFDVSKWAISVTYYHLTELGFYFAKACGIVGVVGDEPKDDPANERRDP